MELLLLLLSWSKTECVMLPHKEVNSKLLKKYWLVFDLSVTFAGGRKNGIKKYEHMVL